jgi:hypothetical protein
VKEPPLSCLPTQCGGPFFLSFCDDGPRLRVLENSVLRRIREPTGQKENYIKENAMVAENTLEKTRNACEILVVIVEGMRSFERIVMDMGTIIRLFLRVRVWKFAPDWICLIDSKE